MRVCTCVWCACVCDVCVCVCVCVWCTCVCVCVWCVCMCVYMCMCDLLLIWEAVIELMHSCPACVHDPFDHFLYG